MGGLSEICKGRLLHFAGAVLFIHIISLLEIKFLYGIENRRLTHVYHYDIVRYTKVYHMYEGIPCI